MKFLIERASDWFGKYKPSKKSVCIHENGKEKLWTVELNTLEDILALSEEVGCDVIVGKTSEVTKREFPDIPDWRVLICDYYIE